MRYRSSFRGAHQSRRRAKMSRDFKMISSSTTTVQLAESYLCKLSAWLEQGQWRQLSGWPTFAQPISWPLKMRSLMSLTQSIPFLHSAGRTGTGSGRIIFGHKIMLLARAECFRLWKWHRVVALFGSFALTLIERKPLLVLAARQPTSYFTLKEFKLFAPTSSS